MNRTKLIITDFLWATALIILVYLTDTFKGHVVLLMLFVVFAFTSCIIRHINYYKHTKRIY